MYSALADYYDTVVLGWSGAARAASVYVQQLPFDRDAQLRVLDIGCGTGLYALAILDYFPHANIWALDSNQAMIGTLRRKLQERNFSNRVHTYVCDMEKPLPLPAGMQVDLVVASGVLEYGNLAAILGNLSPHIQQGGYLFDVAIRDTFAGRILAAFWGCKPASRSEILDAFHGVGFAPSPTPQLPSSYILLRLVKTAHLFKRAG